MKINHRIKFEERYDSDAYNTTTLYFTSDISLLRELVGDKYPEATSMEISIEYPVDYPYPNEASVMISPTLEDESGATDYDWIDIDLPYEEIEELFKIAEKETSL